MSLSFTTGTLPIDPAVAFWPCSSPTSYTSPPGTAHIIYPEKIIEFLYPHWTWPLNNDKNQTDYIPTPPSLPHLSSLTLLSFSHCFLFFSPSLPFRPPICFFFFYPMAFFNFFLTDIGLFADRFGCRSTNLLLRNHCLWL